MTRLTAIIYAIIAAAMISGAVATWVEERGVIEARGMFQALRHHNWEGR